MLIQRSSALCGLVCLPEGLQTGADTHTHERTIGIISFVDRGREGVVWSRSQQRTTCKKKEPYYLYVCMYRTHTFCTVLLSQLHIIASAAPSSSRTFRLTRAHEYANCVDISFGYRSTFSSSDVLVLLYVCMRTVKRSPNRGWTKTERHRGTCYRMLVFDEYDACFRLNELELERFNPSIVCTRDEFGKTSLILYSNQILSIWFAHCKTAVCWTNYAWHLFT